MPLGRFQTAVAASTAGCFPAETRPPSPIVRFRRYERAAGPKSRARPHCLDPSANRRATESEPAAAVWQMPPASRPTRRSQDSSRFAADRSKARFRSSQSSFLARSHRPTAAGGAHRLARPQVPPDPQGLQGSPLQGASHPDRSKSPIGRWPMWQAIESVAGDQYRVWNSNPQQWDLVAACSGSDPESQSMYRRVHRQPTPANHEKAADWPPRGWRPRPASAAS